MSELKNNQLGKLSSTLDEYLGKPTSQTFQFMIQGDRA
jgi:hypothetical protein